ncbi:MAG: hypothetical protein AAFP92_22465, partial [Bacteroidota bacterium]
RRRLLEHFEGGFQPQAMPQTHEEMLARVPRATGATGQALAQWLIETGWGEYLHPAYRIGQSQVDLAILKDGRKIALFCDGETAWNPEEMEKQLKRQQVLERAGWQCQRIQALPWLIHPEQVKSELQTWLAK